MNLPLRLLLRHSHLANLDAWLPPRGRPWTSTGNRSAAQHFHMEYFYTGKMKDTAFQGYFSLCGLTVLSVSQSSSRLLTVNADNRKEEILSYVPAAGNLGGKVIYSRLALTASCGGNRELAELNCPAAFLTVRPRS